MKEEYVPPTVLNADAVQLLATVEKSDSAAPAILAGYVVARAVTKAMKATPSMPLSAINKR